MQLFFFKRDIKEDITENHNFSIYMLLKTLQIAIGIIYIILRVIIGL